jgi:hypothetical protein
MSNLEESQVTPEREAQWGGLTWLLVLAAVISSGLLRHHGNPGLTAFVTLSVILLPGFSAMSIFGIRPSAIWSRLTAAAGLGIVIICTVGAVISYLAPLCGIERPLATLPSSYTLLFLCSIAVLIAQGRGRDPMKYFFHGQTFFGALKILPFAILPVIAVLGAARLNNFKGGRLAEASLTLDVLVMAGAIAYTYFRRSARAPLGILYMSSFAVLLSSTLRGDRVFGWDIQKEYGVMTQAIAAEVWRAPTNHDAYASMLSLTAFPAVLHSVAGLSALNFCRILIPSFLALIPVVMVALVLVRVRYGQETTPRIETWMGMLVGVTFTIGSQVFPVELASIGRQTMALILLAGILLAWLDSEIAESRARALALVFIISLSFVHYSTAYIFMAILGMAWLSIMVLRRIWNYRELTVVPQKGLTDHLISWVTVAASATSAFLWNLVLASNDSLSQPSSSVASKGVGFVSSVTQGVASPSAYAKAIIQKYATEKWLITLPGSKSYHLAPSVAPSYRGVLPIISRPWHDGILLIHEVIVLTEGFSVLFLLWIMWKGSLRINLDAIGLAFAGLVLGGVMRFSQNLAYFYSPARFAFMIGMLTVLPAAIVMHEAVIKFRIQTFVICLTIAILLITDSLGIGSVLVGGDLNASVSNQGETVERFTVSSRDFATAKWLDQVPQGHLVQVDRYGFLTLLSSPGQYNIISQIVPGATDNQAYIFAYQVNIVNGRARGSMPGNAALSTFRFPIDWYNHNYSIVFSTGRTRVYH